jgi:putative tryptophan/tyrosine transport system substrate-binding protein
MHRRLIGLIIILALGILGAQVVSAAQPPAKVPRLGFLSVVGPPYSEVEQAPFWHAMRELGWVEGQNLIVERRFAEGLYDRLPTLAAELVRLQVDILVTYGTPSSLAAKQATTTIPTVMVGAGDPLRAGLVPSLARPGGNITGSSQLAPELGAKRLELLREAVPTASRVAFLWNPTNPVQIHHFHDLQEAARMLGMTLQALEVRTSDDFDRAFAAITRERPDALLLTGDLMHQVHIRRIIDFAAQMRLPAVYQLRENVVAGGLMSYGASIPELFRHSALYVDKILKGAKPADLPIEQPMKFDLVVNLKTAQALGLTIPASLLFQADEVIQ